MAPLSLSPDACYQALKSHDARFDGRFFVGVSSTGIYCRPICRVRLPRAENCTFFAHAGAAEAAGFRPCLRCRPELAPGFAASEAGSKLARAAARLIEDGFANDGKLDAIAQRIGVTARHLRRLFAEEFGVSPVQYAQTQRLLLAKRLLTDTTLPITEIAFASGFSSVRRMNTLFASRYRLNPARLRREGQAHSGTSDTLTLLLPYRTPYDFTHLLGFFATRAVPQVESCVDGFYRRIVRLHDTRSNVRLGWVEVSDLPARGALQLRVSTSLAEATQAVLARARMVFDVATDPTEINTVLAELGDDLVGLRLPGAWDGFELALRAILGQQVTVAAARTLATRLVETFGATYATPFAELTRVFPDANTIAALTRDDLGRLGIVGQRADAMILLAGAVARGEVDFSAAPEQLIPALTAIRGIGPWTAQYITMRASAWPDAWPPGDVALLAALGLPKTTAGQRAAETRAVAWHPWRSYAVIRLWQRLTLTSKERK